MAAFIVPSELRQGDPNNPKSHSSNLLRYVSDVDYKPLPGLEALTGADVMISPDGLPFPRNEKFIKIHIENGARLIQIKFGHDLPGSIIDGRLNEALSRMLKITNQRSWQCLLLFVGLLGYDNSKGMATINGQLSYGKRPLEWWIVDTSINKWMYRGGTYYNLPSGKLIPEHFARTQECLNIFSTDKDIKYIWPKAPVYYDEIIPKNPHLKKWKVAQRMEVVEDLRPLLCTIPGARIGPERATAIFNYMKEKNIHMSFMGFLAIARDGSILNVPGIGKGTLNAIRWGLFRTLEERNERKK